MLNTRGILDHLDKVVPEPEVLVAKEPSLPPDNSLADDPEGSPLKVSLNFDMLISELVAHSSEMHHDKWRGDCEAVHCELCS